MAPSNVDGKLLSGMAGMLSAINWNGVRNQLELLSAFAGIRTTLRVVEHKEQKAAAADEPRVLPCPCPRCGGRMIVIEVFARGCEPTYRPTSAPTPIGIDSS